MKKNSVASLFSFTRNKKYCNGQKTSHLYSNIKLTQAINSFVFPFPVQWKPKNERFVISRTLLKLYWLSLLYKLIHMIALIVVGLLNKFSKDWKFDELSKPILIANVLSELVSLLTDVAFICTADEIVNGFNWSYRMLNIHVGNIKIGNK